MRGVCSTPNCESDMTTEMCFNDKSSCVYHCQGSCCLDEDDS